MNFFSFCVLASSFESLILRMLCASADHLGGDTWEVTGVCAWMYPQV